MEKYFDCFDYLTHNEIKDLKHSISSNETLLSVNGKTFNNRAFVRYEMDKKTGELLTVLRSYYTYVCALRYDNGIYKIEKYWNEYSSTTQKHINAFISKYGNMPGISKKQWLNMPVSVMPY